ncbi:MAG TPA: hypothetical protein VFV40_01405 [Nocardioides sp.]|nr:hypothetical protein [Nocardioides sp.]
MSTDLRDGLHALAQRRAPAVAPPDLWRRGVRRQRRVRLATTGLVLAAVTLGVVGTAVVGDALRTAPPPPAGTRAEGAIPDRLHTPSPWLDGTQGEPPGPLAVIAGAERLTGWRGTVVNGWVGVSAGTGEYRFLDLPGAVDLGAEDMLGSETDPSLSPDGTAVAYWLTHPENADWVGGWASYDTVTGEVVRHRVPSRLGLSPETLEWVGNDTVLVEHSVVTQRSSDSLSATGRPLVLWSATTDALVRPADDPVPVGSVWTTSRGIATVTGRRVELRDAGTGEARARFAVRPRRDVQDGAVDADGRAVALLPHSSQLSVRTLLVGELPRDGTRGSVAVEPLRVGVELYAVLGWKDAEHVLVRGALPGSTRRYGGIYAVDVGTGRRELLVRETRENWIGSPVYAAELWARPPVSRPAPDRAYDPRWLAGAGVAAVGSLVLLVRWRRRARR